MSDPYATYTDTGDRVLIHTAADHRRVWLTNQLARLSRWVVLARAR